VRAARPVKRRGRMVPVRSWTAGMSVLFVAAVCLTSQVVLGKCSGQWAIHACGGGNGKRSESKPHNPISLSEPLSSDRDVIMSDVLRDDMPLDDPSSPSDYEIQRQLNGVNELGGYDTQRDDDRRPESEDVNLQKIAMIRGEEIDHRRHRFNPYKRLLWRALLNQAAMRDEVGGK